nr:rubrerythrin family protein [Desulfobulbaceae bacterium]
MSKTIDNLWTAFAGESQANRKYLAFAAQADKEGHPQAAKLFRAAAAAETIHAHSHLKALGVVGTTLDNLKAAAAGETEEFEDMYPAMIVTAEEEGNKAARQSFTFANEVEKTHAALYQKAIDGIDSMTECDYYICKVCGHTHEHNAPEKCPVCGANARAFFKAE